MEKPMKTQKIPQTDSIKKLARFWDTHDLTDFEDELEEVTSPIFERETEAVMTIPFQLKEVEAIARIAHSRGIGRAELIREWILEKLQLSS
jgi:hypothetical protein